MAASSKSLPSISIIIPTLNAAKVLRSCLFSIRSQKYPKNKITILVIDGGSSDDTKKIAIRYNAKILKNPLKTAESGKAIGIKMAKGELIALIDSDNILPGKNWLNQMILPFQKHTEIIGSEPMSYTYRPKAGFIERYSALTGVNDPYCLIAGNYDRTGYLHSSWTALNIPIKNFKNYQVATLLPNRLLPTIGANGTFFRNSFLKKYFNSNFFFDIDLLTEVLNKSQKSLKFAKVKNGIIHTFCESSISKFYRKQLRRATDLYFYRSIRQYLLTQNNFIPSIKFTLYTILIFPMFFDTINGYLKKPDLAWLFHPIACLITLYTYSLTTLKHHLGFLKPFNRSLWQQ